MGRSHLNLSFRSGKMKVFICFLVAFQICCGVKQGGYGGGPGGPGGPGGNGGNGGSTGGPGGNGGYSGGPGGPGGNGGYGGGSNGGNGGYGNGGHGNGGYGNGGHGNGGHGNGGHGNGGYGNGGHGYGCCAIKAVERNDSKTEMFALIDAYPYYQLPEFCNSMCVYVKLGELKPLLEQSYNKTENINISFHINMRKEDSSMMEEMLGYDMWTMMQVKIKVQGLQKYCFMD